MLAWLSSVFKAWGLKKLKRLLLKIQKDQLKMKHSTELLFWYLEAYINVVRGVTLSMIWRIQCSN